MAITITHAKVSAKPDGVDTSLIQPSDWNAGHSIGCASGVILGRWDAGPGVVQEITLDTSLSLSVSGVLSANISGLMVKAQNLADVTNVATARTNLGLAAIMTPAEFQNNTATRLVSTDTVWSAAAVETLTFAASYTPDLGTFINGEMTLTNNLTLNNPTNTKAGQTGMIVLVQDGTGGRTITFGTSWKFPLGMSKTLSTAAGSVDILYFYVRSSTYILCSLMKGYA